MSIRQDDVQRGARTRLRPRGVLWSVLALSLAAANPGCSNDDSGSEDGQTGGSTASGGEQSTGGDEPSGGTPGDGGFTETGGTSLGGEGGDETGSGGDTGGTPSGGSPSGGSTSGGSHSGGTNTGGSHSGGTNTGGSHSGGTNTGGSHSGGSNTGGSHSGGSNSGGSHSGGTSSGGSHSGGTNAGGTGGIASGGTGGIASGGTGGGSGGSGTGGTGGLPGNVQVTDNVQRNGINCLRVQTPTADYYYDKAGAGFVSIVDRSGRDWVSFKRGGGPDGEFRGIPNMGNECCHPGYTGATTSVVSQTPQRAEVRSTGPGWETRWEFWADKARLTVVDAPGTYYLLYEGTPGGSVGPEDYIGRPDGSLTPLQSTEIYSDFANPEWAYFLDDNLGRAFIVKHGQDDAIADVYWTYTSMTVLGYGRTCKGGCTGLTASGQTLILALTDNTEAPAITALANSLF